MSETQWAEDGQDKPLRKQLPKWVWFCGGGCVLALIATIAIVFISVKTFKKIADPEHGWAELQKIIPADDVHPNHTAHSIPMMPMSMVMVTGPDFTQLQFQQHKGKDAEQARRDLFESETPKFPENMVVMKFTDFEKTQVDVQGRTLSAIRMKTEITGFMRTMAGKEAENADQYMMFLDVTPPGRTEELVLLQMQRPATRGPFTEEELTDLLAPFHIGPNR
jgi:hypothetical protein